jgi:hypothetical protein
MDFIGAFKNVLLLSNFILKVKVFFSAPEVIKRDVSLPFTKNAIPPRPPSPESSYPVTSENFTALHLITGNI